jgi:hypothetical protein
MAAPSITFTILDKSSDKIKDALLNQSNKQAFTELMALKKEDFLIAAQNLSKTSPAFNYFLISGLSDDDTDDDKLNLSTSIIPVNQLLPTQHQISLINSLGYLNDHPHLIKEMLLHTQPITHPEGNQVIILNNKHVIDGHHRWSQLHFINPEATLKVINIDDPDRTPDKIFKLMHLALLSEQAFDTTINRNKSSIAYTEKEFSPQHIEAAASNDCVYSNNKHSTLTHKIQSILSNHPNILPAYHEALNTLRQQQQLKPLTESQALDKLTSNIVDFALRTTKAASLNPDRSFMPQISQDFDSNKLNALDLLKNGVVQSSTLH